MIVLAFDTAGPVIGVAAADGAGPAARVAVRTERVARGAEARLLVHAQAVLDELGARIEDLGGVAVVDGPGAFTGLRVGLATASGLAMSRGVPLWTTGSLDTRGARAGVSRVLSLLDARKGKVYAQWMVDGVVVDGPADVDPGVALGWPDGPFVATGEGALAYADAVVEAGGRVHQDAGDPAVDVLARQGFAAVASGEGIDAAAARPRYLRAPDARPPRRKELG